MEGIPNIPGTAYSTGKQTTTNFGKENNSRLFNKLKSSSNSSFDARQELMRIATASTRSQVKLILTRLGSRLSRLKGDQSSVDLAKKIKKVMAKASSKMEHLLHEERIAEKAKRAEKKRELEESRRLREGLAQRKTHRKLKELDDVKNAELITATSGNYAPASSAATSETLSTSADAGATSISIEA